MTVLLSLTILFWIALLVVAVKGGDALIRAGLPESMRWVALWLLVNARRIEEWRRERDLRVRQVLELEAR